MNGSYGQYLRAMMPFISSAPTSPPEQEPNPARDIDPARSEAVFRSYHHRFGRPPTLDELRGALGLETGEPVPVVQVRPSDQTTTMAAQRVPEPWEVDAVRQAYQRQFGRLPTEEELHRDLGLTRDPTNSFLK